MVLRYERCSTMESKHVELKYASSSMLYKDRICRINMRRKKIGIDRLIRQYEYLLIVLLFVMAPGAVKCFSLCGREVPRLSRNSRRSDQPILSAIADLRRGDMISTTDPFSRTSMCLFATTGRGKQIERLGATGSGGGESSFSPGRRNKNRPPEISTRYSNKMEQIKHEVLTRQRSNDYIGAFERIETMIGALRGVTNEKHRLALCEVVDSTMQLYLNSAFAAPYKGRMANKRISLGMEALRLQLKSSEAFEAPYDKIPKRTLLSALKALTSSRHQAPSTPDAAYRLLQRLVTGVGVRYVNLNRMTIHESDFNMVVNAYSNVGRMDTAQRVLTLQERTAHAPPLSPVAYSILLKGYGRLGDLENIELTLNHAKVNGIIPDTILLNSIIDAYVNSNELDKANHIFDMMRNHDHSSICSGTENYDWLFSADTTNESFRPNRRTYNTILKGLANYGALDKALALANEMQTLNLWDAVTTNTLVQAAVVAQNFTLAESILEEYASPASLSRSSARGGRHPNVEAYTNLLDGYAKAGHLNTALETLRRMEERGINPNEVTYTCIIGALARRKKIDVAKKMMSFMKTRGLEISVITYNSFISGLVAEDSKQIDSKEVNYENDTPLLSFDDYVNESLILLRQMMKAGVRPNAITVSVIVDAFGRCDRPRVEEAKALVAKLEENRVVYGNNTKIATALVQACAMGQDLQSALEAFRRISNPDVAAINAFLDACSRCHKGKIAQETFDYYFRSNTEGVENRGNGKAFSRKNLKPDVISYSIVISALLDNKVPNQGGRQALKLYEEMRNLRGIMVDTALIDTTLKAIINKGRNNGRIQRADIRLLVHVLRDAEMLSWDEGQLERRKRAVQTVVTGRIADSFREQVELYEVLATEDKEDEMFKRHGWNKVDSGFRFWDGGDVMTSSMSLNDDDAFLQAKGWNNVDSGFRII